MYKTILRFRSLKLGKKYCLIVQYIRYIHTYIFVKDHLALDDKEAGLSSARNVTPKQIIDACFSTIYVDLEIFAKKKIICKTRNFTCKVHLCKTVSVSKHLDF